MYGLLFHYPRQGPARAALQVQLAQAQAARAVETNITTSALDHAVIEGTRNMNYTVQGDSSLQPTEIRSEEHTSELQSLMRISYAVFCLNKKSRKTRTSANNTPEKLEHTKPKAHT